MAHECTTTLDRTGTEYQSPCEVCIDAAIQHHRKLQRIQNTIYHLELCRQARAAGHVASFTTDPTWLVHMAINRRAGWPDDPTHYRGSCRPVDGMYPRKAYGQEFSHLRLIADRVNTPRLVVRVSELGEWRGLIEKRLPHRLTRNREE